MRRITPQFQRRLAELGSHALVGNARGMGLIGAAELVADKETKALFPVSAGVSAHVGQRALAYGVMTRALGDNVNLCPPLIIEPAQLDVMFDGIRAALDDTLTWVRQTGIGPA